MLLFDDSKKLEKALGEEAAAVIAHIFEKADDKWRHELAAFLPRRPCSWLSWPL